MFSAGTGIGFFSLKDGSYFEPIPDGELVPENLIQTTTPVLVDTTEDGLVDL